MLAASRRPRLKHCHLDRSLRPLGLLLGRSTILCPIGTLTPNASVDVSTTRRMTCSTHRLRAAEADAALPFGGCPLGAIHSPPRGLPLHLSPDLSHTELLPARQPQGGVHGTRSADPANR